MVIAPEARVCDIAIEIPAVIPTLERLGIGYCCDGRHTLAEACATSNLEIGDVLQELVRRQGEDVTWPDTQFLQEPLRELAGYIVRKHHTFVRDQLKLIDDLMTKVEQKHGVEHPEVCQISEVFGIVRSELTHHFGCEETTLFPFIAALEVQNQPELPETDYDSIELSLTDMIAEHDHAGVEIQTLRTLTRNYTVPSAACPTWRALYRAMEELEADFYQHIHLENNVLFPRALEQAHNNARTVVTRTELPRFCMKVATLS